MKIALDNEYQGYAIRSYGDGQITLNDNRRITTSLILTTDQVRDDWRPQTFEDLRREDFVPFTELAPQVAILGTGARQRFPSRDIMRHFAVNGLSLDVMDTAAACRTFNVLVGEGRRVVMGLLMM